MSSTTSSPSGFLSSPRRQQRLLWLSAVVLAIGVAVFLGVYLSRGTSQPATSGGIQNVTTPPAPTTKAHGPTKVKPSPVALQVARTFVQTAVLQKNLDVAYGLVGPDLKGGETLAQWRKANPVTAYPARNAKTAHFVVQWSHPKQLMLQIVLDAQPGSHVRPSLAFSIGLNRVGGKNGHGGRWVVNYWMPEYTAAILAKPTN